ncbi:hypothetical protein LWI29_035272 [Acer saccharum]|uniref:Uncharacterized protein n=1 Tax=Acer saccharum TaxID=4024 RepID=A0AA39S4F5_ACESA|nr:hypothetical protein LWI29_035272 [Acer saccharum]
MVVHLFMRKEALERWTTKSYMTRHMEIFLLIQVMMKIGLIMFHPGLEKGHRFQQMEKLLLLGIKRLERI